MCKHAYEKVSEHTYKTMIFCDLLIKSNELSCLCISQKYCPDKDRYVELNQKKACKKYE